MLNATARFLHLQELLGPTGTAAWNFLCLLSAQNSGLDTTEGKSCATTVHLAENQRRYVVTDKRFGIQPPFSYLVFNHFGNVKSHNQKKIASLPHEFLLYGNCSFISHC